MARPRSLLSLRRSRAMFGDGERTDVGKRLTRPRTEPEIMIEDEIRRHRDPEHAAARLLHQLEADLDLVGLAADDFGLELDMAGYATAAHDQGLAARGEFGAQYPNVGQTPLPQTAKRLSAKNMPDHSFPQGRIDRESGGESKSGSVRGTFMWHR